MKPIFLLLVAALSGCASTPVARSAAVKPATAEAVASCEYLDDLAGASGRYGVFASSGAEKARMDLMAKAESIGATHVEIGRASGRERGGQNGEIRGGGVLL